MPLVKKLKNIWLLDDQIKEIYNTKDWSPHSIEQRTNAIADAPYDKVLKF